MPNTSVTDPLQVIAHVASAYATRPDATIDDILTLVARLSAQLGVPTEGRAAQPIVAQARPATRPAVPVERAVTEDKVYCLCCGRGFKMLKRHLGAEHGLTEDEYRAMFGLPEDMPLVAPTYSERKAAYARKVGLGKYNREEANA